MTTVTVNAAARPTMTCAGGGIHLHIPDHMWEAIGYNEGSRSDVRLLLKGSLWINGTGHHLEAALVKTDEDGNIEDLVEMADPAMEAEVMPGLQQVYEGAYSTTQIHGKPYVLYMTPYAD